MNPYYNDYSVALVTHASRGIVLAVVAVLAVIAGVVLFFTVFSKRNEKRFHGALGRLYHLMNVNRFYLEDILRFLYVVLAVVLAALGVTCIVLGKVVSGILMIVLGEVALRVTVELLMMFVILCRKSVSIDRKLEQIVGGRDQAEAARSAAQAGVTREKTAQAGTSQREEQRENMRAAQPGAANAETWRAQATQAETAEKGAGADGCAEAEASPAAQFGADGDGFEAHPFEAHPDEQQTAAEDADGVGDAPSDAPDGESGAEPR